jgi:hypothetical protein
MESGTNRHGFAWIDTDLLKARFRPRLLFCSSYFFTASKLLKSLDPTLGRRNSSTVFLSLPQGSRVVHSFCTTEKRFSVAVRNILPQSGFSEYVAISNLAERRFAVTLAAAGNSRG